MRLTDFAKFSIKLMQKRPTRIKQVVKKKGGWFMATCNFFVYCPEEGFDVFETRDEALDAANERIKSYLADGWSEDVTGVCAGEITHRAKMCDQVFPDGEINESGIDDAGDYWDTDYGYKCNYKILPVEQNPR